MRALCLALASTTICSGSYNIIDDAELWAEANTIVIGTVTSITEEEAGVMIHRYIEVDVERYLKNSSESSTLVILYFTRRRVEIGNGTVVADISSGLEPGFRVGEKVLVFLEKTYPDSYSLYGGFNGKYTVINGQAENLLGRVMDCISTIWALSFGGEEFFCLPKLFIENAGVIGLICYSIIIFIALKLLSKNILIIMISNVDKYVGLFRIMPLSIIIGYVSVICYWVSIIMMNLLYPFNLNNLIIIQNLVIIVTALLLVYYIKK